MKQGPFRLLYILSFYKGNMWVTHCPASACNCEWLLVFMVRHTCEWKVKGKSRPGDAQRCSPEHLKSIIGSWREKSWPWLLISCFEFYIIRHFLFWVIFTIYTHPVYPIKIKWCGLTSKRNTTLTKNMWCEGEELMIHTWPLCVSCSTWRLISKAAVTETTSLAYTSIYIITIYSIQ